MKKEISLKINEKEYSFHIDPETPLLYILRNQLELNAPKYGCGLEQCGACMVLMDGKANPSCKIPVEEVQDKEIRTMESLLNGEELHPVQQAFYENQAAQCGFCLNGMVISAYALLQKNPSPDRLAINEGMQRVLCRCGTHTRFLNAVKSVSEKNG